MTEAGDRRKGNWRRERGRVWILETVLLTGSEVTNLRGETSFMITIFTGHKRRLAKIP